MGKRKNKVRIHHFSVNPWKNSFFCITDLMIFFSRFCSRSQEIPSSFRGRSQSNKKYDVFYC